MLIENSSISRASHSVLLTAHFAEGLISTIQRYVEMPPSFEIDFEIMVEELFSQICMTLEPES